MKKPRAALFTLVMQSALVMSPKQDNGRRERSGKVNSVETFRFHF